MDKHRPQIPTTGDLEPTWRSQWVLRNAYGKARLSAKETVREERTDWPLTSAMLIHWEILKIKVAYIIIIIKSETYIQQLFNFKFFALVFALYWALSLFLSLWLNSALHKCTREKYCFYTIHFLKYIQSKISYWYFHELQLVCTSPVHLDLLTCMFERTGVQISVHVTHTCARTHAPALTQKSMVFYRQLLIWL